MIRVRVGVESTAIYIYLSGFCTHLLYIYIPHLLFVEALLTVRMTDPRKKVYLRKRSRDLAQRSSVSPS
jgi:hypothetical protein